MRRSVWAALLVGAALFLSGCGSRGHRTPPPATVPLTFSTTTTTPTSTVATPTRSSYIGPNGLPIETGPFLASPLSTELGEVVNGIQCQSITQLAYTAYAHLQVYFNGRSHALPGGIGLVGQTAAVSSHGLYYTPTTCMYWLHTRAADGLIEVQSPVARSYTLGDLFRVWNQPLSSARVAGKSGTVTATVNGRPWHGSPAKIPAEGARGHPTGARHAGARTAAGLLGRHGTVNEVACIGARLWANFVQLANLAPGART